MLDVCPFRPTIENRPSHLQAEDKNGHPPRVLGHPGNKNRKMGQPCAMLQTANTTTHRSNKHTTHTYYGLRCTYELLQFGVYATRYRYYCDNFFLRCSPTSEFFCLFYLTLLHSSFWTSRGHRCRPFFPLVLAFNFYRA